MMRERERERKRVESALSFWVSLLFFFFFFTFRATARLPTLVIKTGGERRRRGTLLIRVFRRAGIGRFRRPVVDPVDPSRGVRVPRKVQQVRRPLAMVDPRLRSFLRGPRWLSWYPTKGSTDQKTFFFSGVHELRFTIASLKWGPRWFPWPHQGVHRPEAHVLGVHEALYGDP